MDETTCAVDPNLGVALRLITRALAGLAGESTPQAADAETQARAACAALLTVAHDTDARTAAGSSICSEDGHLPRRSADDANALLAEAERVVSGVPGAVRNQIAVCAAMTYLRRARRALAAA